MGVRYGLTAGWRPSRSALRRPSPLLWPVIGLFLTIALMALKARGALLIAILLTTIVAMLLSGAFGGLASASSATTYIESAAGVSEGGRSGLTSLVTGLLFFVALLFSPVAEVVPPQATAAALIVVGFLMCSIVKNIPFGDFEEGFPALMTLVVMPFTYSVTNGFGAGFITYAFIKLIRGKTRELHPMLAGSAVAFVISFALPWLLQVFAF